MKLLYFTDTHIRAINPKNRIDNYLETIKNKINEVADISIKEDVDLVLHGGDLFDRPDTSISVVSDFAEIFQKFKAPIYIVSGNHDIFGQNTKTLSRTVLGLLDSFNILNLINDKKIIFEAKDHVKVQITANPYHVGMDEEINKKDYIVTEKNPDVDYMIHLTHGFLLDKAFVDGVDVTLIDDIKDTKADITFGAHYHLGFKDTQIDGKWFINPGALIRISNSLSEINRKPKVKIIELTDKIEMKDVYLKTALDGNLVLDRSEMERHKFKRSKLNEFEQLVQSSQDLNNIDVFTILDEIMKNKSLDDKVKNEARLRIQKQQEREAEFF